MENTENMPRPEIILVADTVAREKNIDREDVFTAMEVAIQKAGRSKYGFEHDIRAQIDRKTGAISLSRYREVVADDAIENEVTQLTVDQARDYDPKAKIGDFIIDSLPPIDFGRIAAQTAKQVITQKVREAERNRQFEEYKEKVGTIVNGTVKRIEFGNVILDIGKTEAILRRDEIIPREKFKNGDRVRAYVLDVRRENKGPQIFLSRTCPEFMAKLFASEVPEIYDGIVQLLGCDIDVLTEEQEQERRSNENKVRSQRFIEALDVDEMIAHLLIAEGFSTVDEVALVPLSELAEIEGFDEDVATELQKRAQAFIAKRNAEFEEKSKSLGIDEKLQQIEGLDQDMLLTLAGKGVKTIDDLADLAADELIEVLGENTLSETEANKIIMAARAHWFENEETAKEENN